tara:strand:- start:9282 stop:9767 length:486 start_codon:yes stop_codon:yes gene_type:complete
MIDSNNDTTTQSAINTNKGSTRGSILVASLLIVIGFITLYDAASYTDIDSKIFPQTAAIALILFAALAIGKQIIQPSMVSGIEPGVWWRRIMLVSSMLLSCALMPYTGLLIACILTFIMGLIASMHDQWSQRKAIIYFICGFTIMVCFYTLFKFVLHVPLP